MTKYILFLLLIFTLPLFSQMNLSLEEAIRIGLENNFDIQIARNNAEIAKNNKGVGTAGFLPIADAQGGYTRSSTDQETNNTFSVGKSDAKRWNGQASLNWTVFDGFKIFIDRGKYNKLAELGETQARYIIENNIVGILGGYFNVVQQEDLLEVAKNTLEISQTRLNKEQFRRNVGGASSTDLLNAQVSFNNDKSTFLNQELRVNIAERDLNILLGLKK